MNLVRAIIRNHRSWLPGAIGCVFALSIISYFWVQAPHIGVQPYARGFFPSDRISVLLASGDGQAIAAMAQGTFHPVFRWTRPLPAVLTWLIGLGHPHWFPYAMALICVVGCGLLASQAGALMAAHGGPSWLGFLVLLTPGVLSSLEWLSPEALGLGLAIWGWRRRNWVVMSLAGLTRETLLLFAVHRRDWRPIAVYAGGVILALTIFHGNFSHSSLWGPDVTESNFGLGSLFTTQPLEPAFIHYLALALTLGMGLLALRVEAGLAGLYLLAALFIGPAPSHLWHDFSRILLPLWVLGFVGVSSAFNPSGDHAYPAVP